MCSSPTLLVTRFASIRLSARATLTSPLCRRSSRTVGLCLVMTHTDIPAIADYRQLQSDAYLGYAYTAYNYSHNRIAKGDFIRMKEISIAYDVPLSLIKHIGLSSMSLKLQGTNLFLIYSDKKLNGQDPEFMNSGGVAVPMARQFTFTVRLGI